MKFIIAKYRAWPVTVRRLVASEDTGVVLPVEETFVAHFSLFTEEEYHGLVEAMKKCLPPEEGETEEGLSLRTVLARNAWLYSRLVVGWGNEVEGEDGQPLAFSTDLLQAMLTGPDGLAFSAAFQAAILQIRFGVAPEKNFVTSPLPGLVSGEETADSTSSPKT